MELDDTTDNLQDVPLADLFGLCGDGYGVASSDAYNKCLVFDTLEEALENYIQEYGFTATTLTAMQSLYLASFTNIGKGDYELKETRCVGLGVSIQNLDGH